MNTVGTRGWNRGRAVMAGLLGLAVMTATGALGQYWRGRRGFDAGHVRTAREVPSRSTGTPIWTVPPGFDQDTFTFARIRFLRGNYRRGSGWDTDLPDSDLNLSFRLQQMTAMKVDPDGRVLELTDDDLSHFPFIYIVEPGGLGLSEPEVLALRRYLLNGGFLWLDDFWGEAEWTNMEGELKRVFPDRAFEELPLDHPLYRCVFTIKEKSQVPNVQLGVESQFHGVTWERPDAREVHHRVILDDQGRILVFASHNTDNGDGWEREGENDYYFHQFSERVAYPLAVNVLFYVMTH